MDRNWGRFAIEGEKEDQDGDLSQLIDTNKSDENYTDTLERVEEDVPPTVQEILRAAHLADSDRLHSSIGALQYSLQIFFFDKYRERARESLQRTSGTAKKEVEELWNMSDLRNQLTESKHQSEKWKNDLVNLQSLNDKLNGQLQSMIDL